MLAAMSFSGFKGFMNIPPEIEQRIAALEEHNRNLKKALELTEQIRAKDYALNAALIAVVEEVAAHLGVSQPLFSHVLAARARQNHDQMLRKVEDTHPSLAALLDGRTPSEIPDPEEIPRLFPPTPE